MSEAIVDPKHFTRAVTELGSRHAVVTTRAIYNNKGLKIVERGTAVNPGLYERLQQHPLAAPLEDSVASTATVTSRRLREDAEHLIQTNSLLTQLSQAGDVRQQLLETLESIPLPDPIAFQLTLAQTIRPALYQHLLFTALVAAWLAMQSRDSRRQIGIAAAAGLLHDLGMLHLDPLLLEHSRDIDRAQRRQLYSHPIVATILIERHPEYPQEVVQAVMDHHEFLDGSGYPRHLAGTEISHAGRIVALTELIARVFAPGQESPELRLSMLLRMNRHRYDERLVQAVSRVLQPPADAYSTIAVMDDPIERLTQIDGVLCTWPDDLAQAAELPLPGRRSLAILTDQATQLRRTLARVGAAPEQLTQLGKDALDRPLQAELTLLAKEAAWQLRTLVRQTRRRWNAHAGASLPTALQTWLDTADGIVTRTLGASA